MKGIKCNTRRWKDMIAELESKPIHETKELEQNTEIKNLVFIAEHKTLDRKVEFMYRDLYGWDGGEILLDSHAYKPEERSLLPMGPDDSDYIVRLKKEKETGVIIKPIEIISVVALENYCIRITFSNDKTIEFDLSTVFMKNNLEFRSYRYTNREIFLGDLELGYVDLGRFVKDSDNYKLYVQ